MNENMTALVSCFARCYHYKNNKYRIFSDNYAEKILSEKEYNDIATNMANGILFFNPNFKGNKEEALRWIVDNRLSQTVLGRSAFSEKSMKNALKLGTTQYVILESGYDTFAYRNKNLLDKISVFEVDRKQMIEDKKKRLIENNIDISKVNYIECNFTSKNWINNILNSKYNINKRSFISLLGVSYYLEKQEFINFIENISKLMCDGSTIVFDYPNQDDSVVSKTNEQLAKEANEEMKSKYTYKEIEEILTDSGILIYEHLNSDEITSQYFDAYNILNPNNKIYAPIGVSYCLAVKKS